jgi:alkaline phosphatase D
MASDAVLGWPSAHNFRRKPMRRREFLKSAGCFVATATTGMITWPGCGSESENAAKPGTFAFPQGVASADPHSDSVMLWTRAVRTTGSASDQAVPLVLELAKDEHFDTLVLMKSIQASAASDYTVRIWIDGLKSNQIYFYRFRADGDVSRVGRTRTAPDLDADIEPRFAWVCCQDYEANFYSSYRRMINDDMKAPAAEQLHFVMHIGDFIYETRSAGFMEALNDDLEPVELHNANGEPRLVPEFPSGGAKASDGTNFANSLDDYRHLYKTYLLDKDLQDARARWPFITVWDDHEFTDDCWQTQANYDRAASTDEPSQQRRVAASQAWFEYVPAALSDAKPVGELAVAAKDFKFVAVEDAPYSDEIVVSEPNNVKAIGAITLYRNLRWGKHVELVLTDNRSYRSDHALPEEVTKDNILIFAPRNVLPKDAVNAFDAGATANDGHPQDTVQGFRNTRKDSLPGSLLGAAQKQWWMDAMRASQATFKIWGNTVPLLRFLLDRSDVSLLPNDLLLSDDGWDGYDTERKELMRFLEDNAITNVVSLSGDHHAHFAGVVYTDYEAETKTPVMVDIVTAGIASNSQFLEVATALQGAFSPALAPVIEPVKQLIYYDSIPLGGTDKTVVNLNTLIRYGSHAANVAAATNDIAQIEAARKPEVNAHLRYADTRAVGYGLAHVTADGMTATLVTIERSFEDLGMNSPEIHGQATFKVPKVDATSKAELSEPELTGKKPFPLA